MSLFPISPKKLIKILLAMGFVEVRQRGSHKFFYHPQTKNTTVIPVHGSEDIGIGLLRNILRDVELSVEEFNRLR
jgi:predicted RNA binding protein YcfA (HicA-like mRNA interferase family)